MKSPANIKLLVTDSNLPLVMLSVLLGAAIAAAVVFALDRRESVSVDAHTRALEEVARLEDDNAELAQELDLLIEAVESGPEIAAADTKRRKHVRSSVRTDFSRGVDRPTVAATAYLDPEASVIGKVEIGRRVYIGPNAPIRADTGQLFHIGDETNIQDAAALTAPATAASGRGNPRLVRVGGSSYAIFIGDHVSIASGALIHGPAAIGHDTYIGTRALVSGALVGSNVVIEPGAVIVGVKIPSGRYVQAGAIVTDQDDADDLPEISEAYADRSINTASLLVHTQLADAYNGRDPLEQLLSFADDDDAEVIIEEKDESDGHGGDGRADEDADDSDDADDAHDEDGAGEDDGVAEGEDEGREDADGNGEDADDSGEDEDSDDAPESDEEEHDERDA